MTQDLTIVWQQNRKTGESEHVALDELGNIVARGLGDPISSSSDSWLIAEALFGDDRKILSVDHDRENVHVRVENRAVAPEAGQ